MLTKEEFDKMTNEDLIDLLVKDERARFDAAQKQVRTNIKKRIKTAIQKKIKAHDVDVDRSLTEVDLQKINGKYTRDHIYKIDSETVETKKTNSVVDTYKLKARDG